MANGKPGRPRVPLEQRAVRRSVLIEPEVFDAIDSLAKRQGTTIHALMSRVVNRVFGRYTMIDVAEGAYPEPQGSTLSAVLSESPSKRALRQSER